MSTQTSQAGRPRRRWAVLAHLAVAAPVLLLLALLAFGRPNWHKAIYMFQAYVWPKHRGGVIRPPEAFTGIWRTWYPSGQLRTEQSYTRGGRDGRVALAWHPTGRRWSILTPQASGRSLCTSWHCNGRKSHVTEWAPCPWLSHKRHWAERCQIVRLQVRRQDGSRLEVIYEPDPAQEGHQPGRTLRETDWHPNGRKRSEVTYGLASRRRVAMTRWDENGQVVAQWKSSLPRQPPGPPTTGVADGGARP